MQHHLFHFRLIRVLDVAIVVFYLQVQMCLAMSRFTRWILPHLPQRFVFAVRRPPGHHSAEDTLSGASTDQPIMQPNRNREREKCL